MLSEGWASQPDLMSEENGCCVTVVVSVLNICNHTSSNTTVLTVHLLLSKHFNQKPQTVIWYQYFCVLELYFIPENSVELVLVNFWIFCLSPAQNKSSQITGQIFLKSEHLKKKKNLNSSSISFQNQCLIQWRWMNEFPVISPQISKSPIFHSPR